MSRREKKEEKPEREKEEGRERGRGEERREEKGKEGGKKGKEAKTHLNILKNTKCRTLLEDRQYSKAGKDKGDFSGITWLST